MDISLAQAAQTGNSLLLAWAVSNRNFACREHWRVAVMAPYFSHTTNQAPLMIEDAINMPARSKKHPGPREHERFGQPFLKVVAGH